MEPGLSPGLLPLPLVSGTLGLDPDSLETIPVLKKITDVCSHPTLGPRLDLDDLLRGDGVHDEPELHLNAVQLVIGVSVLKDPVHDCWILDQISSPMPVDSLPAPGDDFFIQRDKSRSLDHDPDGVVVTAAVGLVQGVFNRVRVVHVAMVKEGGDLLPLVPGVPGDDLGPAAEHDVVHHRGPQSLQ